MSDSGSYSIAVVLEFTVANVDLLIKDNDGFVDAVAYLGRNTGKVVAVSKWNVAIVAVLAFLFLFCFVCWSVSKLAVFRPRPTDTR